MKQVALLGSTGTIGQYTLEVIRTLPEHFKVVALSAHSNVALLSKQVKKFSVKQVCVTNQQIASSVRKNFSAQEFLIGTQGLAKIISNPKIDMVVIAISGSAGLLPLLWAIENKKDIAIANKEALVMAGDLIRKKLLQNRVRLIPIDSEQSAIWQCLDGQDKRTLKKIYLTASGGPFWNMPYARLKKVTISEALNHPRWKMGRKITVDSATLMNKGLEILETMALFGVSSTMIEVVIHPEAIVHSMVEFIDGSILAQLSQTDMRIPIQYALSYPKRIENHTGCSCLDVFNIKHLSFAKPEVKKFPCLQLARKAAELAGTAPAVLNAANEIAVEAFLNRRIPFLGISSVVGEVLNQHKVISQPTLEAICQADTWARQKAKTIIEEKKWR
ncbi:MAG: 1-deoxy-D-xylulose-5-phosphate reductoisomerase [Candidatus Omnitrophica bacterium]|nr:1-deoxy-D-xylulose-5-phosphate reductoisomerase [Candidatus Omnitrophota bacterium]